MEDHFKRPNKLTGMPYESGFEDEDGGNVPSRGVRSCSDASGRTDREDLARKSAAQGEAAENESAHPDTQLADLVRRRVAGIA